MTKKPFWIGDILVDKTGSTYGFSAQAGVPAQVLIVGKGRHYIVTGRTSEGWLLLEALSKRTVPVRIKKKLVDTALRSVLQVDIDGIHQTRFKRVAKGTSGLEAVSSLPYPKPPQNWRRDAKKRYEEKTNWRVKAYRRWRQRLAQDQAGT